MAGVALKQASVAFRDSMAHMTSQSEIPARARADELRARDASNSTTVGFKICLTDLNAARAFNRVVGDHTVNLSGFEACSSPTAVYQAGISGYSENEGTVRVFDRNLHSRMQLGFMPLLRLKLLHACDQQHASQCSLSSR
jgi:hypothetical protein